MAETRVLLVGDDSLAREGIAALLSGVDSIRVADSVSTEALLRSADLGSEIFDVIVADPQGELEILQKLSTFDTPILALVPERRSAREHLIGNVRALLLRQTTRERLVAAIEAIAHQLVVVEQELIDSVIRPSSLAVLQETLTSRESEVLQLLAAALSNKEIASRLGISEHTAKFHVNAILAKLGAENRTEAVVLAARLGLVAL